MKKKVLVTGASGFIGRHTIKFLLSKGYEVHAVSNQTFEFYPENITFHQVDLLNSSKVTDLIRQVCPSHLLHFAWYAVPGKYWTSDLNLDWVSSSIHLIKEFISHGGKRIVMAGSCAEYDWNYEVCCEFKTPLSPQTLYGNAKASLFKLLDSYSKEKLISYAWGRIFFLYGPHEYPQRLVSSIINSLIKNENAKCSHGLQYRDFLHVDDVADAFCSLLDSDITGPVNIASGEPVQLKNVISMISEDLNGNHLIQLGAYPTSPKEPLTLYANVERLKNELNWSPKYSLENGLKHTISWWKQCLK